MIVALLARTGTLHSGVLLQARKNGKPLWILLEGEALDRARSTLLARHASVLAQCKALMPAETNEDTVVMTNVHLDTEDTAMPHVVRATAWSYATLTGWIHSAPTPIAKARAHG
jgi:hypothetical protein